MSVGYNLNLFDIGKLEDRRNYIFPPVAEEVPVDPTSSKGFHTIRKKAVQDLHEGENSEIEVPVMPEIESKPIVRF